MRASKILAAAGVGEFVLWPERDRFWVSQRMASITGIQEGEWDFCSGQALLEHIDAADQLQARQVLDVERRGDGRQEALVRFSRPDNRASIWLSLSSILDSSAVDAPLLIGAVREAEPAIAELDHRVKNAFAAIQSLASQSARSALSLDSFVNGFASRIQSLGINYSLLMASGWRGVSLERVVAAALQNLPDGRAHWSGPDVILDPRAVQALGAALHELGSNALTHGALSGPAGNVIVTWRPRVEGGVEMTWTETGGPQVSLPTRLGFGRTILERVTGKEVGGAVQIAYEPDGLRASIIIGPAAYSSEAPPTRARSDQLIPNAPPRGSSGASAEADIRGVRVLIVEDALLLALELDAGLTEAGAVVVGSAADLPDAMRLLELPCDIVVLDADLAGVSAEPVARRLIAMGRPFIFATGYGDLGGAPQGFDVPCVQKPYNVRQISAALATALRAPSR